MRHLVTGFGPGLCHRTIIRTQGVAEPDSQFSYAPACVSAHRDLDEPVAGGLCPLQPRRQRGYRVYQDRVREGEPVRFCEAGGPVGRHRVFRGVVARADGAGQVPVSPAPRREGGRGLVLLRCVYYCDIVPVDRAGT